MSDAESNARCIEAVKLTIRFVLLNCIQLGMFLLGICAFFGKGFDPGVNVGLAIVVLYFTVAYKCYGRGNRASLIIAGLAGVTATGAAAATYSNNDGEWDSESNSSTGFVMADLDAMEDHNGVDMNSGMMSGSDVSMSDDFHHSVNPANLLPMINDVVDIHGNMYGTTSVDDMMNSSASTSDDCFSHSSFDSGFHSPTFDDDWNK
ncbi:hypothetical protein MasN3_36940 [Massilia varians]|uniref:Transmembrane protein n=1 Tax=Massilia varians TaxID=457921 RepID=A0ABM8CA92_9BURK|nr:hypothetical protein [Massilia varians]BDT60200.1 hypothetical protein MasN3_36940 [Massilia varians]